RLALAAVTRARPVPGTSGSCRSAMRMNGSSVEVARGNDTRIYHRSIPRARSNSCRDLFPPSPRGANFTVVRLALGTIVGAQRLLEGASSPTIESRHSMRRTLWAWVGVMATVVAMGVGVAWAVDVKVTLSGREEVPPGTASAPGSRAIPVAADHSFGRKIATTGIK